MGRCTHEEADTRLVVHISDALANGANTIFVRTIDTDVIIILIALYEKLSKIAGPFSLWTGLGKSYKDKNFKMFCCSSMFETLGREKSESLHMLHAFTGCDSVSPFNSIGKKTTWRAAKEMPAIRYEV